jgi:hypothetical protein
MTALIAGFVTTANDPAPAPNDAKNSLRFKLMYLSSIVQY